MALGITLLVSYLRARTLPDRYNPVLVWMEHLAHLAHRVRVCGAGGEVAIQVQATKKAPPAIVAVSSVGQAPGHQGMALQRSSRKTRS